MSQETTSAEIRGEWQALLAPLAAKPAGLEALEPFRAQLSAALDRSVEITKQQAELASNRQVLTKELQGLMDDGQRLPPCCARRSSSSSVRRRSS